MGQQARAKRDKRQAQSTPETQELALERHCGWSGRWICSNRQCTETGSANQAIWRVNPYNGQVALCCPKCSCRVLSVTNIKRRPR